MEEPKQNLDLLKSTQTNGVKTTATPCKKGTMFIEEKHVEKI